MNCRPSAFTDPPFCGVTDPHAVPDRYVRFVERFDICAAPWPQVQFNESALDVDLKAELDLRSGRAAAQTPIFRRDLDQRDLDIERRYTKRFKVANDSLIQGALGHHRASGK